MAEPTVADVFGRLQAEGRIAANAVWTSLSGGVSCEVHRVTSGTDELVVKWGQSTLRTSERWESDPSRTLREAAAMIYSRDRLGPLEVPEVVFVVPELNLFAMRSFASASPNWRSSLLAGEVDPGPGRVLGTGLAHLHALPTDWLSDPGAVVRDELRVEPFYAESARRLPALADHFEYLIARMRSSQEPRLVHGDVSPKNVILGVDGSVNLVDWEVIHLGDPAFDVGMFSGHILCKSIVAETAVQRAALAQLLEGLWSSYAAAGGAAREHDVVAHAAGVALARIHGRSPSDYLARPGVRDVLEAAAIDLAVQHSDIAHLVRVVRTGGAA